jgi:acyl-CoA thioesterase II
MPFQAMMELAAHGPDTYVGHGPRYPWEGLYGGQVVAQALQAAALTVEPGFRPHSLHANFLRLGDPDEPVRYEVERLRNGNTFFSRQVVARQSTGAILNMSASFKADGAPTMDVQLAQLPEVPAPEDGKEVSWGPLFELRLVHGPERAGDQLSACSWFRVLEDLGDEPVAHAAALAYVSDSGPAWLVAALHEEACSPGETWRPVSLDHAVWFHRSFRADRWLLLQASTGSLYNSIGLARGRVFSAEGRLVASVAQEVLLRRPRRGPAGPASSGAGRSE